MNENRAMGGRVGVGFFFSVDASLRFWPAKAHGRPVGARIAGLGVPR